MSDVGGVSVRSEYSFICYQLIESAEHMRLDSSAPGYVVLFFYIFHFGVIDPFIAE